MGSSMRCIQYPASGTGTGTDADSDSDSDSGDERYTPPMATIDGFDHPLAGR